MSKRLWILPVLVATLVVLSSGAGFASMPSLMGPTGVVTTPNAMVAPMGQIQVALTYQRMEGFDQELRAIDMYDEFDVFQNIDRDETTSLWGIQALAAVANGAELWAAYSKDNSDVSLKTWGLGGKYQFPNCGKNVNFAVGASYRKATGDTDVLRVDSVLFDPLLYALADFSIDGHAWDAYLAATADLTAMGQSAWCGGGRLLGSAGVLYKKVSADCTRNLELFEDGEFIFADDYAGPWDDDSLTRPFVSVEYLGQDRTSLGLEYRWKDNTLDEKAVFSAVLRHEFEGGFTGEVGVTNSDQFGFGLDDQNWFARVGYNFGMCK